MFVSRLAKAKLLPHASSKSILFYFHLKKQLIELPLSKEHKKAEIGFWLLPENWGKGYISESVPLVCDYAFNQMGLHRLEGFVDPENANCKKAMSRLGFKLEGTMKDCEVKNGAFMSLDIYAKVNG